MRECDGKPLSCSVTLKDWELLTLSAGGKEEFIIFIKFTLFCWLRSTDAGASGLRILSCFPTRTVLLLSRVID